MGKCVDSLQRHMAGSYCRSDSGINEVSRTLAEIILIVNIALNFRIRITSNNNLDLTFIVI